MAGLSLAEMSAVRLLRHSFVQVNRVLFVLLQIAMYCAISILPILYFLQQTKQFHVSTALAATETVAQDKTPRIKTVQVYRWNPETPEIKPKVQEYKVDLNS